MNNKKTISSFAKLGIAFVAIAVVFGIIIQAGANHPPLRFPEIGEIATGFIQNLAQKEHQDVSLKLSSQGPFKWDNDSDLGAGKKLGQWAQEFDSEALIYYRRDKDAIWQGRAQGVLESVDRICEELSEEMGRICCSPDSANGRRLAVYLPETSQEYAELVLAMSNGEQAPNSTSGCSFIQIGPLGCKSEGIIIHPDLFSQGQDYRPVLRKELARYAFYSSVDFNQDVDIPDWLSEGYVEYFSMHASDLSDISISKDITDLAESALNTLGKSIGMKGRSAATAGASLLQYISQQQGGDNNLSSILQKAFSEPGKDPFSSSGLDFEKMKKDWAQTLRGILSE